MTFAPRGSSSILCHKCVLEQSSSVRPCPVSAHHLRGPQSVFQLRESTTWCSCATPMVHPMSEGAACFLLPRAHPSHYHRLCQQHIFRACGFQQVQHTFERSVLIITYICNSCQNCISVLPLTLPSHGREKPSLLPTPQPTVSASIGRVRERKCMRGA